MSTMVMCDQPPASGMFQRYPSPPPLNYAFNGFGYGTPGSQHPQDYQQFPMGADGSVPHPWYSSMYGPRTDEWSYGTPAGAQVAASTAVMTSTPAVMGSSYRSMGLDYSQQQVGQMSSDSPADTSSSSSTSGSPSNKQLRPPYDWMKKASYQAIPTNGKTRTKDKYRVVYSDHQRLELEKEFHYSRYITIRRKAELAQTLALSERQVKIWFQNRRAKERKQNKKREENTLIKMPSDLSDLSDDSKLPVQQHMGLQMTPHAQHQVQVTSPSPKPPMHAVHNPYGGGYPPQTGNQQVHMSPQNALSPPQNHVTGHNPHYSSPNNLALPISPVHDVTDHQAPQSHSVSPQPVSIKTDVDAVSTS